MYTQTISIKDYLIQKGISFRKSYGELITRCLFNGCDDDSKANEAHLYFNVETGQYECKKCGEKGNIVTLAKHLGDSIDDILPSPQSPTHDPNFKKHLFNSDLVNQCHQVLPSHIRLYLNNRGILNEAISTYKLGWGEFYGKHWITIPIKNTTGNYAFFKLRQDPSAGNEKMTYPKGIEAQLYDWEALKNNTDQIVVCEGELDRILLISKGVPAVTSTHGALTFKQEWVSSFDKCHNIYICYDNDEAGRKGAERVAKMFIDSGRGTINLIALPQEVGEGGDITDYFIRLKGTVEDLFGKYTKEYPQKIDVSQFKPLSVQELLEILGLTIKKDNENKIVTFLCELAAYTDNAQFNISYNAPSSTGKSYIPTEIASLFPKEDVIETGYCSPTAFFHEVGEPDPKQKGRIIVDLSRKILIFLEQPHMQLLERLRSLLSHDKKEIYNKITDKTQKQGLRTKNVILKGFPSVIFCTAGLRIDEQEATRFLLLSPEVDQEKIRAGIVAAIKKESDNAAYQLWLEENKDRQLLKKRIEAIRQEHIMEIKIASQDMIEKRFFSHKPMLKPRHQRDIKWLFSLIKSFALLNLWWRDRHDSTITASNDDIELGFVLWDKISRSQDFNLPPFIYSLYQEVILPAWKEKNGIIDEDSIDTRDKIGISRQEIFEKHYKVYGRMVDTCQLRQQILPMLETAGLITQEPDSLDKRRILIYPTMLTTISETQKYSGDGCGVNENNSCLDTP